MAEQNKFIQWVTEHKKEIIIGGVCGASALAVILLTVKYKGALPGLQGKISNLLGDATRGAEKVVNCIPKAKPKTVHKILKAVDASLPTTAKESMVDIVETTIQLVEPVSEGNVIPFEVSRHLRTLPKNHHASPEKIASALKYNIVLAEGQTWVESYMKGVS